MSSGSSQIAESWIASFCAIVGHEYFAEVSEDFIEDDFNLTGLSSQVPLYKDALEMILDVEPEDDEDDEEEEDDDDDDDIDLLEERPAGYIRPRRPARLSTDIAAVETSAELLYGLIHQRYITSRPGLGQMHEKYELGHFGVCPRVFCASAKVLPVGCSDTPTLATVKLFCPSCLDVYTPPNSRFQTVDGAYFGTTFGCLFLMTFPDLHIAGDFLNNPTGLAASPSISATTDETTTVLANNGSSNRPTMLSLTPSAFPLPPQPAEINGVTLSNFAPSLGHQYSYESRIYGFRVSERARTGPRMKWLRSKPDDINELDEARRFERMGDENGEHASSGDLELKDARVVRDAEGDEYIDDAEGLVRTTEQLPDRSQDARGETAQEADERRKQRKKAPMRARRRTSSNDDGGGTVGDGRVLGPGGVGVGADVNGVGVR